MNEEIDDTEFYHQDFTTASEWEIFVSRIEEIIHQWKIDDQKGIGTENKPVDKWNVRSENINFADVNFVLTLYCENMSSSCETPVEEHDARKTLLDGTYDFVLYDSNSLNDDFSLATWYGLKQFIVLSATNSVINNESRLKILLSSVNVAVSNSNCDIPIFVQFREPWQKLYVGVHEKQGIRTNFEMIHLKTTPRHCKYLSGLLNIFKSKIMSPVDLEPALVSIQHTYHLTHYGKYTWKQELPAAEQVDDSSLNVLPFGVSFDPISCVALRTRWVKKLENMIMDTEVNSDFDAASAPMWSLLVKLSEQPICLLADCLMEFLSQFNNGEDSYGILGDYVTATSESNNPLDLLTESNLPLISHVLKQAARSSSTKFRKDVAPLAEEILVPLLYYLFPDATENSTFTYLEKDSKGTNDIFKVRVIDTVTM